MSAGVITSSSASRAGELLDDGAMSGRAMLLLQASIWLGMFVIFFRSPVLQMSDSQYSMLTAESIIHNHTPDLSGYWIKNYQQDLPFDTISGTHAYQLGRSNGKLLYGFPHGTSILSLPFVAAMDLIGVSPATPDRKYNLAGEVIDQKMLAALLMASLAIIFFRTAMLQLDWGWSAIVAIGAGLGTQVWSTASRGMWSHTWEILLTALAVYLLLASAARGTSIRPIALATLLAWMFFVRPTAAGTIICVSLFVLIFHRREFIPYAITGALWLAALVIYSMRIFGTLFPSYYQQGWATGAQSILTGIFGMLFSPSRGLFVFCPVLVMVFYLIIRNWRALISRPLAILPLASSFTVFAVIASHQDWWGGSCYGPRYLSDTVPWMVLLAIIGIAAMPATARNFRSPSIALGALLLVVGIAINSRGALSMDTFYWNDKRPLPAVMLDWSRPQFLAGLIDEN
jgi:hypothetical protein